tara:strand:- start:1878 stop:2429 length:552 start_codon:yes stop_codon:yes gene_type:complete
MREEIPLIQVNRLMNCGTLAIITASDGSRSTITPCAWNMPASKEPPLLFIALSAKHFSFKAIQKSKEFVVNIAPWSLMEKMLICAKASGSEMDKFKESKLTAIKSKTLKVTPKIDECIGNLECKLVDSREIGDHFILTGQVLFGEADNKYFKDGIWDTSKTDLIFHLGGEYFFKSSPYFKFER